MQAQSGFQWVGSLLGKRMCQMSPTRALMRQSGCGTRSLPFPCAMSQVFQGCLGMQERLVGMAGTVDMRNIQVNLFESAIATTASGPDAALARI